MVREQVEYLAKILARRLRSGRLARSGPVKLTGDGSLDPGIVIQIVLSDAEDLLSAVEAGEPVTDERWLAVLGDLEALCELTEHPAGDGVKHPDVLIEILSRVRSMGIDPQHQNGRSDERPGSP